jgi:hypothetical protein
MANLVLKVKDIYHFILRKNPIFFALIYAVVFKFSKKKISKKKNPTKKIFVLNKIRFWKDLEELDKSESLEFFCFEKSKMSLLIEPFVKTIRKKIKSPTNITYWHDYKDEKFFTDYLNSHSKFIFHFLKYFNCLNKFDAIITPSLWYLQDQALEKGANLLNKRFIFLHKENSVQNSNIEEQANILKKRLINFGPMSFVVVYNENTKKLICKTKKIDANRIFILGCPRIDEYVKSSSIAPKAITLSSFRYDLSLNYFKAYDRSNHPFEANDKNLILFFDKVHSLFIDLAVKYKNEKFLIKIKYSHIWKKKIEDLIFEKEKKINCKIINLKIISNEVHMSEVLQDSKLLIGINSLSLVEARILGIPCIVPNFKIIEDYDKHLFFKSYFNNELIEVKDENDFNTKINFFISKNFEKKITKHNKFFIEEFFGFNDGKNTKRNINFLKNL